MVGDIVAAGLSASVAIEAVRLLARIVDGLDIVADNGREMLCAFIASPELHDALCIWGASAELDEPEACDEEDHRAFPRVAAPVLPEVACERLAPPPPPVMADVEDAERSPASAGVAAALPVMLANCGVRYFEAVVRSGAVIVAAAAPCDDPALASA